MCTCTAENRTLQSHHPRARDFNISCWSGKQAIEFPQYTNSCLLKDSIYLLCCYTYSAGTVKGTSEMDQFPGLFIQLRRHSSKFTSSSSLNSSRSSSVFTLQRMAAGARPRSGGPGHSENIWTAKSAGRHQPANAHRSQHGCAAIWRDQSAAARRPL